VTPPTDVSSILTPSRRRTWAQVFGTCSMSQWTFLTMVAEDENCMMPAVIPHGVTVPLHSYDDFEGVLIFAGSHRALVGGGDGLREIGRPVGAPLPTPQQLGLFVETADRCGYQLRTAEKNAAVGIMLPACAGSRE
jgi:hypothetical protein